MGASRSRVSRCRSVRLPSLFSHTCLVPLSASRFSSDSRLSAHLTLSVALENSRITWKRSIVWAARGICSATAAENEPHMSRVTSAVADLSPPWASSCSRILPTGPLSLPSVTATQCLPSRSSVVDV